MTPALAFEICYLCSYHTLVYSGAQRQDFDSDDEDEYYAQMLEDKLQLGVEDDYEDSDDDDGGFVYMSGASEVNESSYEAYKKRVMSELEEEEEDKDNTGDAS